LIGDHLIGGHLRRADGLLEELAGGLRVATRGHEHVDDLPELIDGAVDVTPPASHLHVGLINLPAAANSVSAGPSRLGQQRRESLDPAVDGDVIDLHTTFGEQLLNVAVRQRKAQVPAHCKDDHVGRQAEASEGRPGDGCRATTAGSPVAVCLRRTPSQQMQQRPTRSSGYFAR
jgi:hypothetical protein